MQDYIIKNSLFILLLIFFISGCTQSSDKKIKKDKMVDLYADVLILSSVYEDEEEPALYEARLDSLLSNHGVDRRTFEQSLEYYKRDPHRWKNLIDSVIKVLEERRDQVRASSEIRSSS